MHFEKILKKNSKQNVWFQERMHLEKIRLDKIQNGRLSANIHFHMAVICSTVLDG